MAPEQVRRERLTPASDVYGLGALLYELLTGRWPTEEPVDPDEEEDDWDDFTDLSSVPQTPAEPAREEDLRTLYPQLVRPPVPPRQHNPQISPELERLLLRCLQPQPEDRFRTVSGLLAALAPLLRGRHRLWPEAAPVERRADTESR